MDMALSSPVSAPRLCDLGQLCPVGSTLLYSVRHAVVDVVRIPNEQKQEFLPAVAMPLILCVILEDFTIDEIPEAKQKNVQLKTHLISHHSAGWFYDCC